LVGFRVMPVVPVVPVVVPTHWRILNMQNAQKQMASRIARDTQDIAEEMARRKKRDAEDITRKRVRDAEDTQRKKEREGEDMDWAWERRVKPERGDSYNDQETHDMVAISPKIVAMLYGDKRPVCGDLLKLYNANEYYSLERVNPERCTVPLEQLYLSVEQAYTLAREETEKWLDGKEIVVELDLMIRGVPKQFIVSLGHPMGCDKCCDASICVQKYQG
jgi:hypothetical protein